MSYLCRSCLSFRLSQLTVSDIYLNHTYAVYWSVVRRLTNSTRLVQPSDTSPYLSNGCINSNQQLHQPLSRRYSRKPTASDVIEVIKSTRDSPDFSANKPEWHRNSYKQNLSYNHGLPGPGKVSAHRLSKHRSEGEAKQRNVKPIVDAATELLFGLHPCLMALSACRRVVSCLYIRDRLLESERSIIRELISTARQQSVEIKTCTKSQLDALSLSRPHQGVCLGVSRLEYKLQLSVDVSWISEISTSSNPHTHQLWLVLDCIQDPMNFGAILRSAYYLGVDRIFVTHKNSCPLSPVVSKASAGVMEILDIHALSHLPQFLQCCKEAGWTVYGTSAAVETGDHSSDDTRSAENLTSTATSSIGRSVTRTSGSRTSPSILPLHHSSLTGNTVLILGNEGSGLSDSVRDCCDVFLSIRPGRELNSGLDSLNVSVSIGILLYHLCQTKTKL